MRTACWESSGESCSSRNSTSPDGSAGWALSVAHSRCLRVRHCKAALGIAAALGAGVLWGTMYIPYRKAYLTGMNPLSFISFFTVGELVTMGTLAITYRGAGPLGRELWSARSVLFWLALGGFVWVIGDLFQQYATKYVGISRGIYLQVGGGSLLMALGAVAIALSSATIREHSCWRDAAYRESERYSVEQEYVRAGMEGRDFASVNVSRSLLDWLLILGTTVLFVILALMARLPKIDFSGAWATALTAVMLAVIVSCSVALWRTTRFR
jgi:magnesium-transporting ATPase (P-type)